MRTQGARSLSSSSLETRLDRRDRPVVVLSRNSESVDCFQSASYPTQNATQRALGRPRRSEGAAGEGGGLCSKFPHLTFRFYLFCFLSKYRAFHKSPLTRCYTEKNGFLGHAHAELGYQLCSAKNSQLKNGC